MLCINVFIASSVSRSNWLLLKSNVVTQLGMCLWVSVFSSGRFVPRSLSLRSKVQTDVNAENILTKSDSLASKIEFDCRRSVLTEVKARIIHASLVPRILFELRLSVVMESGRAENVAVNSSSSFKPKAENLLLARLSVVMVVMVENIACQVFSDKRPI